MAKTLCIQVDTKRKLDWQKVAEIFKKFNVFGQLNCNTENSGENPQLYYSIGKEERMFGAILWLNDGITKAIVNAKARTFNNSNIKLKVSSC